MLAVDLLRVPERHAVLRALRSREARLDRGEIEFEDVGVVGLAHAVRAPHALRLRVGLDQRDLLRRAAGELEVADRLLVDREDAAGAAELRRHVGDRRAIGERQAGETVAEELDELVHHALLAQHLGDRQHQVGGRGAGGQGALQPEADHVRNQHGDGLAEHRGLGLDAADAPAEHAEAVDHGGVRIGADQRVGIGALPAVLVVGEHDARQVFHVDLVDDAGVRRHDLEVAERRLAPAQERIALAVAGELDRVVLLQRIGRAVLVDLHRVVDDEFGGRERVDLQRIAAEARHGLAHRREVDDDRHAGEVLHDDARGREGDLVARCRLGVPLEQRLDVGARDVHAVLEAEQVLEQDLEREGQAPDVEPLDCRQVEDLVGLAAHRQRLAGLETVFHATSGDAIGPELTAEL